jgi:hypothetical protein
MWLSLPGAVPGLWAEIIPEFKLAGWSGLLFLVLGSGVLVILWTRKWRQSLAEPTEDLTVEDYRKLLEAGVLDAHEYERIRATLEDEPLPPAQPPEIRQGIQDLQLRTGIRRDEPPPSASSSDPAS